MLAPTFFQYTKLHGTVEPTICCLTEVRIYLEGAAVLAGVSIDKARGDNIMNKMEQLESMGWRTLLLL